MSTAGLVLAADADVGRLRADLDRVETITARVLEEIPSLDDEHVLMVRRHAAGIGGQAWRIVCACDAELKARKEAQRGRGHVDGSGRGRKAAVAQAAEAAGVAPRTVYQNAQIHDTFFAGEQAENSAGACTILEDKEFYAVALHAPDPQAALAHFAQKKEADPGYSTRDARKDVRALKAGVVHRGQRPLPEGQFAVLYADPPWEYEAGTTDPSRVIENQYPTMTLQDVRALPVGARSAADAILFLWAPNPKLEEALSVMAAWGFSYRTNVVWVKDRVGLGHWVRQQHELLLIGRRGSFPTPAEADRPSSVLLAPRTAHSAKPSEVYALIERMYPDVPYLELFARRRRPGWVGWGYDVPAADEPAEEGAVAS